MDDVEVLHGGNWNEVVRVGDTVRRPHQGSDFATRVLEFLSNANYAFAPEYRGRDDEGRDVLEFIPGQTTSHPAERSESAYRAGARMLRMLHDVTAGSTLAADSECVLHGDPGPFNTIFEDGMPVAFIDWDASRPGTRVDDVAYFAWTWCILDIAEVPLADQATRLGEVRRGYDHVDRLDLVDEVLRIQQNSARAWRAAATRALGAAKEQHLVAAEWAERQWRFVHRNQTALRGG